MVFLLSFFRQTENTTALQFLATDTEKNQFNHNNEDRCDNPRKQQEEMIDMFTMIDAGSESMCFADIYKEDVIHKAYCMN